MSRSGQMNLIETDIYIMFPFILTVIFLVFTFLIYGVQDINPVAEESSLIGSVNTIQDLNTQTSSGRGTASLPNQVMTVHFAGGDRSTKRQVQEFMYYRDTVCVHNSVSCPDRGPFEQGFGAVMGAVVPDRTARMNLTSSGTEVVARSSSASVLEFGRGPAKYQGYVPLPGGDRVEYTMLVGGLPLQVRWRE